VLGHVWRGVLVISLLAVAFFFLADRLYSPVRACLRQPRRARRPRGLPVLVFIVSLLAVLAQPVFNALSRYDETEADRYSLETVDLPDALASALVKTAEYRNPRPHPLQEADLLHAPVRRAARADGDGVEGGAGRRLGVPAAAPPQSGGPSLLRRVAVPAYGATGARTKARVAWAS